MRPARPPATTAQVAAAPGPQRPERSPADRSRSALQSPASVRRLQARRRHTRWRSFYGPVEEAMLLRLRVLAAYAILALSPALGGAQRAVPVFSPVHAKHAGFETRPIDRLHPGHVSQPPAGASGSPFLRSRISSLRGECLPVSPTSTLPTTGTRSLAFRRNSSPSAGRSPRSSTETDLPIRTVQATRSARGACRRCAARSRETSRR